MSELTKTQQEAVQSNSPATLVIAGPGTGKTHILASRVAHLVSHQGVSPEHILALTFTESGANAMRTRVISFLGTQGYKVTISTFHSFASRLIDDNPDVFGYRRDLKALTDIDRAKIMRSIISDAIRDGLVKELTTAHDPYFYYYEISSSLSALKREGISVEEFSSLVTDWEEQFDAIPAEEKTSTRGKRAGSLKVVYEKEYKRILKNRELGTLYERYEEILAEQNRYDYEDMVNRARAGIGASSELAASIHDTYHAILVDEYQDTNGSQNKLLFSLINPDEPNVFVVGDDDQAIQRFQGATIQNFADFIERFPKATIVTLADNFRSPQFILDAALSLAKNNTTRITAKLGLPEKQLAAHGTHALTTDFTINQFGNDIEEHSFLIENIKRLNKEGTPFNEIAVLTRSNREQLVIAEALRGEGIPHTTSAEANALTQPAAASLFTLVSACRNPRDDSALISFLRHPATPIAIEDVYAVLSARGRDESVYDALTRLVKREQSRLHEPERAQKTLSVLNHLSQQQEVLAGAHWFQAIIEETGFLMWAIAQPDASFVIANIRALTDEAKRLQEGNEYVRIDDVMDHFQSYRDLGLSLRPSLAGLDTGEAVRVMTAHQAKGQEFDYVFLVHAVEGTWSGKRIASKLTLPPSIAATHEDEEDARRLFYVALTRAKRGLFITFSDTYINGVSGLDERSRNSVPSIFITELQEHLLPAKQTVTDTRAFIAAPLSPKPPITDRERDVIRGIVSSPTFALNATSINTFLECPNAFLYESVLRVPKVRNMALTYGEAIHLALQKFFEAEHDRRSLDFLM
ncbi:MAG: ATP-dependent DNA helicase, partial [Candidatus Spechtbacterales bacterium]